MEKWVKDIQKGNRTFRLTFMEDTLVKGFWHCVGEEIYRKKKNIFDFTWKEEVFEFYTGNGDIVKKAIGKIKDIFPFLFTISSLTKTATSSNELNTLTDFKFKLSLVEYSFIFSPLYIGFS